MAKSYTGPETVDQVIEQLAKVMKDILGVELDPNELVEFKGDVGKRGRTYPDMTWEPKESFRAVADYFAN